MNIGTIGQAWTRRAGMGCLLGALVAFSAQAAEPFPPERAASVAADAYLYFYPLISMELTKRQMTNAPAGTPGMLGPANVFKNLPAYPTADMRAVVRPNFDTLYSSAWLDLKDGPALIDVPDMHGRYYLLPMLDMWTDVFASPGWRTTGTGAQTYVVVPPGWTGKLPEHATKIQAPTRGVWVIGRIKTDGPADYDAVHKLQAGLKLEMLDHEGKPKPPAAFEPDPTVDMKTPPKVQVDTMDAAAYFKLAAEILKSEAPHLNDQPILAQLARMGFEPGKPFDLAKVDPDMRKAFEAAPATGLRMMAARTRTMGRIANGWMVNTEGMGTYGTDYLGRATVAQVGLGANLPQDAIYPLNLVDETGKPLDGANDYVLHFAKGDLPPTDAFWSVTLYDGDGFQVANALNRFAISSWMPLVYNADGSLDLYVQHADPGAGKNANWLPAPQGPFNLTMRLYAPQMQALTGGWNPPPVLRSGVTPQVVFQ